MKKYLVFTYLAHRARGGMKDLLTSFDTLEDALLNIPEERNRYFQVVERDSLKVVKEGWSLFKYYDPHALDLDDPFSIGGK
jgi:hypothetical protein